MMNPEYSEAISRYQGYRDAAYAPTWQGLHKELPAESDLKVMPIDEKALVYWQVLKKCGFLNKFGGFPWDEVFQQIHNSPKRFDVSIWDGKNLAGMACGMASAGGKFVTVKWLERFQTDTRPFQGRVAEIALTAADHYAAICERETVRIKNPMVSLIDFYGDLGFVHQVRENGNLYLQRTVVLCGG